MKVNLLLVSILFISPIFITGAFADTLKDENEIRVFTDSLMTHVAAGKYDDAFNSMKKFTPLSPTEIDSVLVQLKAQREQYGSRYGSTAGYEFIRIVKLGESLIMMQYIEKTNMHALPWTFYFYKNKEGWILNSFNWNDDYKPLFK